MTLRMIGFGLVLLAPAALLPAPAQAFTMVDPNGGGSGTGVPKFDIEEHTRQFRTGEGSNTGAAIREFQTPWGSKGTVNFGVNSGPMIGSPLSGFRSQDDRRHMDRMLAPPGLQYQYDR